MGEEAEALVDFLSDIPSPRKLMKKSGLYCKHEIIAEFCHFCRHDNPTTIKVVLQQENLAIVRNLDSWVTGKTPTT